MRIVIPLLPVYNHRLGVGYLTSLLRAGGHEVILLDLEQILRIGSGHLSLRLIEETEVYGEQWAEQIHFFHRPELLFGALWPLDPEMQGDLNASDWSLIEDLRPHLKMWSDAIVGLAPNLLLMPALVSNLWIVLWLSELVNRANPRIPRILGGRGLSYEETRELILRAKWAEGILAGEADSSIVALATALESGISASSLLTPGLVRMSGDEIIQIQPNPPADLDRLPIPDFTGLPFPGASLRHYYETGRDFHDAASIGGSRWCARHCAYCYESIYPKNYRLRQVTGVLNEIEIQRQKLGTPRIFFCDSTLNLSPTWLEDLTDGMLGLSFRPQVVFAHFEPRRLGLAQLEKMREAGFEKVNFGVESLDQRMLQRMDRGLTVEETEQTLANAIDAGISVGVNFISNYPGETQSEFENTMLRAARLGERVRKSADRTGAGFRMMVSQARVDPHSSLYVNRERFGIRVKPRRLPVPASLENLTSCIERIAFSWEDGLSRAERQSRFSLMRRFIEGLSIPASHKKFTREEDRRIAVDFRKVPKVLLSLVNAGIVESVQR